MTIAFLNLCLVKTNNEQQEKTISLPDRKGNAIDLEINVTHIA